MILQDSFHSTLNSFQSARRRSEERGCHATGFHRHCHHTNATVIVVVVVRELGGHVGIGRMGHQGTRQPQQGVAREGILVGEINVESTASYATTTCNAMRVGMLRSKEGIASLGFPSVCCFVDLFYGRKDAFADNCNGPR